MKYQVLFSLKNNEKYLLMSSAAAVYGALRVKITHMIHLYFDEEMTTIQYSARFGRRQLKILWKKRKKTEKKITYLPTEKFSN